MRTVLFPHSTAQNSQALAITDLSESRTWIELEDRIHQLAQHLSVDLHVGAGDHIALLIGNRIEFVESVLAGMLCGAWVTPINTHLTAAEISYICDDSNATVVLSDSRHIHLLGDSNARRLINVETLCDLSAAKAVENTSPAGGTMVYTSGTTGRPKGVKRAKPDTVSQMLERMRQLGATFGFRGAGPHLVTGPMYHAAPGLFAIYDLLNGAPMVIMPKWDCDTFFTAVRDFQVTTTHLVPTMFVRLLEAKDNMATAIDITSLRYVMHGAAPISQRVKKAMIDWWGPILVEYWGASESGVITLVTSEEWRDHPGTVGRAIANFDVFVGDDQGEPSDAPEGMLFARHRHLEQVFEYHGDLEKTRKAHPKPSVFCLGDIGRVDAQGFVYLSDRESNMIISGGVNIYPQEVEDRLMEIECIQDICVFGVEDDEWGEQVKALIQLAHDCPPNELTIERIQREAREKIAAFKIPRLVQFVDQIPRTPTGKVIMRDIKSAYGRVN